MKKILYVLIVAISVMFVACNDDSGYDVLSYEEQLALDIEKIQTYLTDSSLTAESTESGLHYIIEEEGTGSYPTVDSTVNVKYVGMLLNGDVFDEGTIKAKLGQFIYGWQEGIPLFNEGGSGTLFIPSSLGYGYYSVGSIPANSVLVFDIELIGVSN